MITNQVPAEEAILECVHKLAQEFCGMQYTTPEQMKAYEQRVVILKMLSDVLRNVVEPLKDTDCSAGFGMPIPKIYYPQYPATNSKTTTTGRVVTPNPNVAAGFPDEEEDDPHRQ